jgi:hypothetical protein
MGETLGFGVVLALQGDALALQAVELCAELFEVWGHFYTTRRFTTEDTEDTEEKN